MSEPTIAEMREMLEEAPPTPWYVATGCSWRRVLTNPGDEPVIVPTKHPMDGHPDINGRQGLDLCVAAVNALPSLLDRVEKAERELAALREMLTATVAGEKPPLWDGDDERLDAHRVCNMAHRTKKAERERDEALANANTALLKRVEKKTAENGELRSKLKAAERQRDEARLRLDAWTENSGDWQKAAEKAESELRRLKADERQDYAALEEYEESLATKDRRIEELESALRSGLALCVFVDAFLDEEPDHTAIGLTTITNEARARMMALLPASGAAEECRCHRGGPGERCASCKATAAHPPAEGDDRIKTRWVEDPTNPAEVIAAAMGRDLSPAEPESVCGEPTPSGGVHRCPCGRYTNYAWDERGPNRAKGGG